MGGTSNWNLVYVNIFFKCGNNSNLANIFSKFVNQHNIQARSFDKKWPPGVKLMGMQHSILHLLSWSQAAKTAANTKHFVHFCICLLNVLLMS